MMETFFTVFEQMFRILILLAVGFVFHRMHLIPRTAEQVLSRLVTLLFLPAITLYTNLMECRIDSLADNRVVVLYGVGFCCLSMGVAVVLARWFGAGDANREGIYRYAFSFTNTGAVATPLVLSMFGTAGLFQLNLYLFFPVIFTYSWGILQLQPHHKREGVLAGLRKAVNPNFAAMALGMVLGVLGAKRWLPEIVLDTVGSLGDCYVTISLILTGFSIGDYSFGEVLGDRKVYAFTLLRLLVIPGAFLLLLKGLRVPEAVCLLTTLAYACPCGMNTVVYPLSYGQDCRDGVSMVLISSVCAMVTVPLMWALATAG